MSEQKQYMNFILSKYPRDFTFTEMMNMLWQIFDAQSSLFNTCYQCLKLEKNPNDNWFTYAELIMLNLWWMTNSNASFLLVASNCPKTPRSDKIRNNISLCTQWPWNTNTWYIWGMTWKCWSATIPLIHKPTPDPHNQTADKVRSKQKHLDLLLLLLWWVPLC